MTVISQRLSQRVLPWLQLTRMALVFTAIADSFCELLLRTQAESHSLLAAHQPADWKLLLPLWTIAAVALMSTGLYGFGMSFNDIVDCRRDQQISPQRPLPSGRIRLPTAHVICGLLLLVALVAGAVYAQWTATRWASLILLVVTVGLISFYDLAGKYLVWLGLITLGLIRFANAVFAAPTIPVVWHPLLLFDHVTILSTIAYILEDKRPTLRPSHLWNALAGLSLFNISVVSFIAWYRFDPKLGFWHGVAHALSIHAGLVWPVLAVLWFCIIAWMILRLTPNRRTAGERLMLTGLLWLIVYDAAFVGGYVSGLMSLAVLMLLPIAGLAVLTMRGWSQLVMLSAPPQYQRAGRESTQ